MATIPTPQNLNEVTLDYILSYIEGKGAKEIEWLNQLIDTPVAPNKNGRERRISFMEIRKEFTLRYMPDLAPKAQDKKPSMYDRIKALRK